MSMTLVMFYLGNETIFESTMRSHSVRIVATDVQ